MEGIDPNKKAEAPQKPAAAPAPKMQLTAGPPRGHHVMVVVVVSLITAVVAGGVVWFWMNNNAKAFANERADNLQQLETAQESVKELTERAVAVENEMARMELTIEESKGHVLLSEDEFEFYTTGHCAANFAIKRQSKDVSVVLSRDGAEVKSEEPAEANYRVIISGQSENAGVYQLISVAQYRAIDDETTAVPLLALALGEKVLVYNPPGELNPPEGCRWDVRKK